MTNAKMQFLFIIGFSLRPEENKFPGLVFFLSNSLRRSSVRLYSLRVNEWLPNEWKHINGVERGKNEEKHGPDEKEVLTDLSEGKGERFLSFKIGNFKQMLGNWEIKLENSKNSKIKNISKKMLLIVWNFLGCEALRQKHKVQVV